MILNNKILSFIPVELKRFLIVGLLTVAIDFSIYQIILSYNISSVTIAKGTSFVCGTLFSYCVNKIWTFTYTSNYMDSAFRFIILYSTTLFLNVNINLLFLEILHDYQYSFYLSFLIATASSAVCNFLGMKMVVFKKDST